MNTYEYNQKAWDAAVAEGNQWTLPSTSQQIERARMGDWQVLLTPETPVPHAWFGTSDGMLNGKKLLGLACGGGQQGPIFAAAGAEVTIFDASAAQLGQDRIVAQREGLQIETLQGNMKDLSALPSHCFDIVFNPCSVCFVDAVRPVWREAARVLKPGGALLTGFVNPWFYLFDMDALDAGRLEVTRRLPHRDIDTSWGERLRAQGEMLEFSHTLSDLIGGQLEAGLMLTHMFEDGWKSWEPLNSHAKALLATRAIKPN